MMNFTQKIKEQLPKISRQRVLLAVMFVLAGFFGLLILKGTVIPPMIRYAGGAVFILGLAVAGFLRPEWVLYVFTAYIPFAKQMPGDFDGKIPGFTLTNFMIFLSAILWLTGRFGPGTRRWRSSELNRPILIFAGLGILSILQGLPYGASYVAQASLQFCTSWGIGFYLFFLILHTAKRPEQRRLLVQVAIISATFAALMASYDYLSTRERAGGIFDHANLLASFFSYYLFIPLAFFLFNLRSPKGWVYFGSFLILVRGLLVSFSRGGYLALLVGGMVVAFCRSRILFFLLLGGVLFTVTHPELLPEGVRARLAQTIEKKPAYMVPKGQDPGVRLDRSTSDRFELWKAAGHVIRQSPLWGAGYDRFLPKMQNYWYAAFPFEPHNTFLFIAAEMGLPAMGVFLWILGLLFYQSIRIYVTSRDPFYRPLSLGFLGGLFGFIISNCYAPRLDYPEVSSLFWILTAILFLYESEKPEKNEKSL